MPQTYIALLRAINVGGHTVKMDRLRELFAELGFENVRSFIQSGNVFFESDETDRQVLTNKIEAHLLKNLGYEVAVMLRTIPELESIFKLDPFKNKTLTPETRFYVLFISAPLPNDFKLPHHSPKGDFEIIQTTPGEAFLILKLIDGRPGNPSAYLEKTFGVKATARFYHTTFKILEAAKQL